MFQGLLLLGIGVRAVDDMLKNLVFTKAGTPGLVATVTSTLVLTPRELELWNNPGTDIETRAAIYRRGLLRYDLAHRREVA